MGLARRSALVALATGLAITLGPQLANARVLQLYTEANGNVYVQLSGTMSNLSCTLVSSTFVTLQPTASRFKEIYASLLVAQPSDRTLAVRINTGSAGCPIAYINSVQS